MRILAGLVAIAALGGCNAIFGLDPTHGPGGDDDIVGIDGGGDTIDAAPCIGQNTHDEDGDGAPDACDFCPHVAELVQVDTDGDGVGDACDPGTGPHHLVSFDPLEPAGTDWHLVFGIWFNDSAGLKVVDSSADALAYTTATLPEGGTVDVGIHLDAVAQNGGAVSLWYRAALDIAVLEGYACRVANVSGAGTQLTLTASDGGNTFNLGTQDLGGVYTAGQDIRLRGYHEWNGGGLLCESYQPPSNGHLENENTAFSGGQIGVGTTGTALTVEYIWIIAPGDG